MDQPACLEDQKSYSLSLKSTQPVNQIAGLHTCHNFFSSIGKDKLIKIALKEGVYTATTISAAFRALTSAFAPTPALASAPGPPGRYTQENPERAIKLVLKLFIKSQKYGQANFPPQNRLFKVKNLKLYYSYLHIECYYFCWQCKDYFNIAEATRPKHVSFIASFF